MHEEQPQDRACIHCEERRLVVEHLLIRVVRLLFWDVVDLFVQEISRQDIEEYNAHQELIDQSHVRWILQAWEERHEDHVLLCIDEAPKLMERCVHQES